MEWSIQEIARLAGTTSRTLRHYDAIGLLPPSRVGKNGYRYYDQRAVVRLQRILLLRDLGLSLATIAEVLDGKRDDEAALAVHLEYLKRERTRLEEQIASVETTIGKMKKGEPIMAEEMLKGFDHTQYREEVVERWGEKAYADGDRWWRGMSDADRDRWLAGVKRLSDDWAAAAEKGLDPAGDEAQELARRQAEWLAGIPGTPKAGGKPARDYFIGLGDLYVADERFTKNYGGNEGATFVRDAMRVYGEREL